MRNFQGNPQECVCHLGQRLGRMATKLTMPSMAYVTTQAQSCHTTSPEMRQSKLQRCTQGAGSCSTSTRISWLIHWSPGNSTSATPTLYEPLSQPVVFHVYCP